MYVYTHIFDAILLTLMKEKILVICYNMYIDLGLSDISNISSERQSMWFHLYTKSER